MFDTNTFVSAYALLNGFTQGNQVLTCAIMFLPIPIAMLYAVVQSYRRGQ